MGAAESSSSFAKTLDGADGQRRQRHSSSSCASLDSGGIARQQQPPQRRGGPEAAAARPVRMLQDYPGRFAVLSCRRGAIDLGCSELVRQATDLHDDVLGAGFVGPSDGRWVDKVVVAVSETHGAVVGQAGVRCRKGWTDVHVVTLAVDPRWRRKGVGKALLDGVKRLARDRGFRSVTLHVDSQNQPALMLYRKAGFSPTGLPQPHMYGQNRPGVEMRAASDIA